MPVLRISPAWVTSPELVKSSGILWTGVFWDGISFIPGKTVIPMWLGRHCLVSGNRVYCEKMRMTVG